MRTVAADFLAGFGASGAASAGAVAGIEQDGVERLDAEPLIERLKTLVRPRKADQKLVDPDAEEPGETAPAPAPAPAPALADRHVVRVTLTLAAGTLMPGVRAYQAIAAVGDHGEVLRSEPEADALDDFDGGTVKVWLASDHPVDAIRAAALAVTDVAAVDVRDEEAPEEPSPEIRVTTAAAPRPARQGSTVRIDAGRLDELMHLMGELVVHRTRVESLAAETGVSELAHAVQDLTRSSQALQAMVMQVRMIPVESVLMRFPRLVRDLSSKLGKQVELVLTGKETELDRTVIEALGDPIVHLVRNSLDHGLESPEQRVAAGKPPTGTLEISARHAGGNVVITVTDDGRGIDPSKVGAKAVERGLIAGDALPQVDMAQAIELLFTAGFSTAETTSDISGRGVGMDAVRTTIRELGGEVELQSEQGKGSTVTIRLPLTLAIMAALQVETRGLPFAIPLDRVERTLQLHDASIRSVAGRRMLVLRDSAIPLLDAASALGYEPVEAHDYAVIVHGTQGRVALAVERLVGQRELVTRPLPPEVGDRAAVSGGAVLSDGNIALIVDCDAIFGQDAPRARLAA